MLNFNTDRLFVDTETAGLPTNTDYPVLGALDHWPRTVQIAWERYSKEGEWLESESYIVQPEGFEIPEDAAQVHGITTERARREGTPLRKVLAQLQQSLLRSGFLIAHNIEFDGKILEAEYQRLGTEPNPIWHICHLCTMRSSISFCGLQDRNGRHKYPTLQELHQELFGVSFKDAHDAGADVRACARCFFELERRGVEIS